MSPRSVRFLEVFPTRNDPDEPFTQASMKAPKHRDAEAVPPKSNASWGTQQVTQAEAKPLVDDYAHLTDLSSGRDPFLLGVEGIVEALQRLEALRDTLNNSLTPLWKRNSTVELQAISSIEAASRIYSQALTSARDTAKLPLRRKEAITELIGLLGPEGPLSAAFVERSMPISILDQLRLPLETLKEWHIDQTDLDAGHYAKDMEVDEADLDSGDEFSDDDQAGDRLTDDWRIQVVLELSKLTEKLEEAIAEADRERKIGDKAKLSDFTGPVPESSQSEDTTH